MEKRTTEYYAKRIGTQITSIRCDIKHLSAEQLCDLVNNAFPDADKLSPDTLIGFEAGSTDISAHMLFRILAALGFEIGLFKS